MNDQDSVGAFDPDRILAALDTRGVEYVLVGGVAARAHGARRATGDIDCVPSTNAVNLERLAEALRELGARLRAAGMSDAEAKALPLQRLSGRRGSVVPLAHGGASHQSRSTAEASSPASSCQ